MTSSTSTYSSYKCFRSFLTQITSTVYFYSFTSTVPSTVLLLQFLQQLPNSGFFDNKTPFPRSNVLLTNLAWRTPFLRSNVRQTFTWRRTTIPCRRRRYDHRSKWLMFFKVKRKTHASSGFLKSVQISIIVADLTFDPVLETRYVDEN
jgi:hypothetical protein